ncbi:MAG: type II secretion system protein [Rubripirellula sp.]
MISLIKTRPNAPEQRQAFTLVELLVTIVILGIISGMVSQALIGANRQAKETRAQAFINQLNLTMLQLYETEATRSVGLPGQAWSPEAASQTQLIWRRDWLRASLPMSKADIDVGSGRPAAGSDPAAPTLYSVPFLSETGAQLLNSTRQETTSLIYRNRVVRKLNAVDGATPEWATAYSKWTDTHESAECLYLIFATNTINGQPLLGQLRTRDVADTDEDGMLEIVDPWGVPVVWMRSPVGYYLKNTWSANDALDANKPTVGELKAIVAKLGEDPLDILRSDPRTKLVEDGNDADLIDPTTNDTNIEIDKVTFYARPMIVSAGLDGEFDLLVTPSGTTRATQGSQRIASLASPQRRRRNNSLVPHPIGYGSNVFFPDPFYSVAIVGDATRPLDDRPGAVVDVNGNGVDESADNIYPSLALQ